MVTGRNRQWAKVLSIIVGVGLLLMGAISVLVFVSGLVSGDPDVTDNVSGAVVLTVVIVVPGWLLVRWGRRGLQARNRDVSTARSEYTGITIPSRNPRSGRLRLGRVLLFFSGLFTVLFGGMALLIGVLGLGAANAGGLAGALIVIAAINIPREWFRW